MNLTEEIEEEGEDPELHNRALKTVQDIIIFNYINILYIHNTQNPHPKSEECVNKYFQNVVVPASLYENGLYFTFDNTVCLGCS